MQRRRKTPSSPGAFLRGGDGVQYSEGAARFWPTEGGTLGRSGLRKLPLGCEVVLQV